MTGRAALPTKPRAKPIQSDDHNANAPFQPSCATRADRRSGSGGLSWSRALMRSVASFHSDHRMRGPPSRTPRPDTASITAPGARASPDAGPAPRAYLPRSGSDDRPRALTSTSPAVGGEQVIAPRLESSQTSASASAASTSSSSVAFAVAAPASTRSRIGREGKAHSGVDVSGAGRSGGGTGALGSAGGGGRTSATASAATDGRRRHRPPDPRTVRHTVVDVANVSAHSTVPAAAAAAAAGTTSSTSGDRRASVLSLASPPVAAAPGQSRNLRVAARATADPSASVLVGLGARQVPSPAVGIMDEEVEGELEAEAKPGAKALHVSMPLSAGDLAPTPTPIVDSPVAPRQAQAHSRLHPPLRPLVAQEFAEEEQGSPTAGGPAGRSTAAGHQSSPTMSSASSASGGSNVWIKFAACSIPGCVGRSRAPKPNQDSFFTRQGMAGNPDVHVFGVCDGHGSNGAAAAQHVSTRFPAILEDIFCSEDAPSAVIKACVPSSAQPPPALSDEEVYGVAMAINAAAKATEDEMRTHPDRLFEQSGTTLVAVVLLGANAVIANVGDSRCVLGAVLPPGTDASSTAGSLPSSTAHSPAARSVAEGSASGGSGGGGGSGRGGASSGAGAIDHDGSAGLVAGGTHMPLLPSSAASVSHSTASMAASDVESTTLSYLEAGYPVDEPMAVLLTQDHKPDDPLEHARITAHGGIVRQHFSSSQDAFVGPMRVWSPHVRNGRGPGLAMSRSIGDLAAAAVGVVCDPTVVYHRLTPATDRVLLLASDGLWDAVDAVDAIHDCLRAGEIGEKVTQLCVNARAVWLTPEASTGADDITAVILQMWPSE